MFEFHITVHPRRADDRPGATFKLRGQSVPTLLVDPAARHFSVTFEEACDSLQALGRMFVEPDGSLVWTGENDNDRWQLEGVLYDECNNLLYAEIWGRCPPTHLDQLLGIFGWPRTECIFCLVREGVWLDESEFRRFALRS
jgi:hypothetical protein